MNVYVWSAILNRDIRKVLSEKVLCEDRQVVRGGAAVCKRSREGITAQEDKLSVGLVSKLGVRHPYYILTEGIFLTHLHARWEGTPCTDGYKDL